MTQRNPTRPIRGLSFIASLLLTVPLAAQTLTGGAVASTGDGSPGPFPEAALPVQWADFNADGLDDALAVTTTGRLALLQSRADGTFLDVTERVGLEPLTNVIVTVFQDHDHDGWADVFAATSDGRTHLMQNLGGSFLDVTPGSGIASQGAALSAHWMDYDADGRLDLHLVTDRENTLFRARGEWSFTPIPLPIATVGSQGTTGGADGQGGNPDGAANAGGFGPSPMGPGGQISAGSGILGSGGSVLSDPRVGGARTDTGRGSPSPGPSILGCANGIPDASGSGCILASSVATLGMLYPLSSKFFVDDATGRVGIGTTTPSEGVEIIESGFRAGLQITETVVGRGSMLLLKNPSRTWRFVSDSSPEQLRVEKLNLDGTGPATAALTIDGVTGNVGIGTQSPVTLLDVNGSTTITGFMTVNGNTNITGYALIDGNMIVGQHLVVTEGIESKENTYLATDSLQRVGIGTTTPATTLDVDGAITIRGGADIVETFESSCGILEPGTVVVIDPDNPGALMCSSTAYDTKVAGVVSGAGGINPGLLLGQDDMFSGDTKVAMTGRVYVNCSTENGPIVPGDRLTTATREGHAMKVNEQLPSSGCVIGKAMSSLESGSGLVLVLVNLQ